MFAKSLGPHAARTRGARTARAARGARGALCAVVAWVVAMNAVHATPGDASAPAVEPFVQHLRDVASEAVMAAFNYLGVPYQPGGHGADQGFDCSGFTRYIFGRSLGLWLPRRAHQQAHEAGLVAVAREQLKPGDLVFFNTLRRAFSHVGIYIGEGRFIHSPRVGGAVRIEDMRQAYWVQRFDGARRADLIP